jgi:CRP-like cAMP-binding protein
VEAANYNQLFAFFQAFQPLSPAAKAAIATISRRQQLAKNEELQPIGYRCRTIYFLETGIARVFYYKDGMDITDSFAFENNIIVRVESLFTGQPSRKGIQLLEEASLVAIDADRLLKLYDSFPEIERLFRKVFEANHVETVTRIESIQFHAAEERYKALLAEKPDLIRRVPLKYIASYLGITQVSLSRIRSQR